MKALSYCRYGSSDNLHVTEIPTPEIRPNEILVKVLACSLNSWDADLVRGRPWYVRFNGPFRPGIKVLGSDIVGSVVCCGHEAEGYSVGDVVYADTSGYNWGGLAEYAALPVNRVARKHPDAGIPETACLPQAGVLALQSLRMAGDDLEGKRIAVNGAGGGVGILAVQLFRNAGAHVTAIDKPSKFDTLRSIGANRTVDYREIDFTKEAQQFDIIVDNVSRRSAGDYFRSLKPGGKAIIIGGTTRSLISVLLFGQLRKRSTGKTLGILAHKIRTEDFDTLSEMLGSGKIEVIIDRICSLDEIPGAMGDLMNGDVTGKVILKI